MICPMGGVYHLIYTSEAAANFDEDQLRTLVRDARENNAITGITGVLLYKDRGFIQILEGDQAVVDGTFDLIRADPRHRNIRVIYRGVHARREFGNWSMGFQRDDESAFNEAMGICSGEDFFEHEGDPAGALVQLAEIVGARSS